LKKKFSDGEDDVIWRKKGNLLKIKRKMENNLVGRKKSR